MKLKTIILPLFAALGISLSSCYYGGDGSDCGGGCISQIDGKRYGEVHLNDSNKYWLNFNRYPSFRKFVNKQGTLVEYEVYWNNDYQKQYLNSYRKVEDDPCCPDPEIRDYTMVGNIDVGYNPQLAGVAFNITRAINLKAKIGSNDSLKVISSSEVLLLRVNGKSLTINTDTLYLSNDQKFHNKITFDNKDYESVFEIIDNGADPAKVLPKGFYFSFQYGLIGYYFTNGEQWTLR